MKPIEEIVKRLRAEIKKHDLNLDNKQTGIIYGIFTKILREELNPSPPSADMDTKARYCIQKHLDGWTGLKKVSIEHFAESGKASGSFFMALKEMLNEYAESIVFSKQELDRANKRIPVGELKTMKIYISKYPDGNIGISEVAEGEYIIHEMTIALNWTKL